jgi:hypothetical protein
VSRYGETAWELDALDPNDLRNRLVSKISDYINPEDWQRHREIEAEERETTRQIAESMARGF